MMFHGKGRSLCVGTVVMALLLIGAVDQAAAQVATWTNGAGAGTGDFFDGANWDIGTPGAGNIALIDGGGTATIDAAGTGAGATVGALLAGNSVGMSGHYQMDSGFLTLDPVAFGTTSSSIAAAGGSTGSFVMNGGILHNGPVATVTGQTTLSGATGIDFIVASSLDATGTFEMHGDSEFRGIDDITFGNGSLEHDPSDPVPARSRTTVLIDGNSQFSVGDGFNFRGEMDFTLAGNADFTLGNSMGVANPAGAYNENSGYINIGSRYGSKATMVIEDNAVFNASRIQNNKGTSSITVRDNGEFNIFNTSTGGTEVDFKGQSYLSRESSGSFGPSSSTVILEGSGKFTVDSDPITVNGDGSDGHIDFLAQSGLTLAAGDDEPVELSQSGGPSNPGGNDYPGGVALIDIKDSAEFSIVQDLWMTYGNSASASSTVKVTGPNAIVSIGEDLNMAIAIDQFEENGVVTINGFRDRDGTAALHSVITGSTHSVIQVGDEARIDNGDLIVELDGYSPVNGDSYTLLATGNSNGVTGEFDDVDLSLAPLSAGLSWSVDYFADSVVLSVVPEPSSVLLVFAAAACLLGKSRSSRS